MALDLTPLLAKAAELAEELDERYGAEAELVDFLLVVEVDTGHGTVSGDYRTLRGSAAAAVGLSTLVRHAVLADDGDDDDG